MTCRATLALIALIAVPTAAAMAQHGTGGSGGGGGATRPSFAAPREATQYDFMLGQWELTVRVPTPGLAARIHGTPRLVGTWKAWRALDGWGIEDELRITDEAGNPMSLAHAVRVYDATARRWSTSTLDVYRGRFTTGAAEWRDGEMHVTGRGTDQEGRAYVTRTRYYDITADRFRFQQDRSTDDGRTWTEGTLRIEARREAAAAPR